VYFQADGLGGFLIGEIFIALGASFQSGSDTALLYESLVQAQKETTYKRISGVYNSLSRFAEASGAILAGIVAVHGLKLPFMMDLIANGLTFLLILTLVEPPIERFDRHESSILQLKQVFQYIFHGHTYILWLLIVGSFLSSTSLVMVWVLQPYMQEV